MKNLLKIVDKEGLKNNPSEAWFEPVTLQCKDGQGELYVFGQHSDAIYYTTWHPENLNSDNIIENLGKMMIKDIEAYQIRLF